jgi:hypothetical protein
MLNNKIKKQIKLMPAVSIINGESSLFINIFFDNKQKYLLGWLVLLDVS